MNNYIPCDILFPEQKDIRTILHEFINDFSGFKINVFNNSISIDFKNKNFSCFQYLTENSQEIFQEIIENTVDEYFIYLFKRIDKQFLNKQITNSTISDLNYLMEIYEKEKLNKKEYFKEMLMFNLGLLSNQF